MVSGLLCAPCGAVRKAVRVVEQAEARRKQLKPLGLTLFSTTKAVPSSLFFVEPIPNEFMPPWAHSGQQALPSKPSSPQTQTYAVKTVIDTPRPGGFVYAPHFYDLNVLFSKVHSFMSVNVQGLSRGMFILKALYFGEGGLRKK